jgi:uncharacterized protein (DUF1697 family)
MAGPRALVAELGYGGVRTVLNSGDVVYTAPGVAPGEAAARIERALAERTGVAARVMALTAAELADIVAENPLGEAASGPSRLLVTVLADPADREKLEPLARQEWAPERIALGTRVAYLWCPDGVLASRLPEAVGRVLGDAVTTRNGSTVTKLHALAAKPAQRGPRRSRSASRISDPPGGCIAKRPRLSPSAEPA